MATKHNCKCIENAGDDEPIFVLRAQDKLAPSVVRFWADELADSDASDDRTKIEEAYNLATEMEDWQSVNGSKLPD